MANAQTIVTITHDKEVNADILQYLFKSPEKQNVLQKLGLLLDAINSGSRMGSVAATLDDGDGVKASGTVTFSSLANNDTVTIAGVVFTAKTSGASGANQFNLGADDTAAAVNFIAKVNAHTSLARVLSATSALGVSTITAYMVGLIGNQITLAISAHGSVSAANLASGANAANQTSYSYSFGV